MFENLKTLLAGNVCLQFFNTGAFEFYDLPTPETDQMIMVLPLGLLLETGRAIAKLAGGGPSALRHESEGTVYRGVANLRVSLADSLIELIHAQMISARFYEHLDNGVSLTGGLEAAVFQETMKRGWAQSVHGAYYLILKFIFKIPT
jgi:hypothetical protein